MFNQLLFWRNHPIFLFGLLVLCGYLSCAHSVNNNDELAQEYLNQHKQLALQEMERMGVPASIKLAQGMLETNYGQSKLAIEGKNHFGIKCKNYWKGATIYITDDAPNECFRKYQSTKASYIDHSNFLMFHRNGHYSHLFNLPITDYEAWAKGLKKAGYATNPRYSQGLIRLIQRYHLYELDEVQPTFVQAAVPPKDPYISDSYTKPTSAPTVSTTKTTNTIVASVSKSYTKPQNRPTVVKTYPSKPSQALITASNHRPTPPSPKPTVTSANLKTFTVGNKKSKRSSTKVAPIVPKSGEATSASTNPSSKVSFQPIRPKSQPAPDRLQINDVSINNCYAVYANLPLLPAFIANHYNLSLKKVYEYNNIQAGHKFKAGQPIYLQKKKRKAAKGFQTHTVGVGESMLDIAQKYGMQLSHLYKLNKMPAHAQPEEGETIYLRRKAKRPPKLMY